MSLRPISIDEFAAEVPRRPVEECGPAPSDAAGASWRAGANVGLHHGVAGGAPKLIGEGK